MSGASNKTNGKKLPQLQAEETPAAHSWLTVNEIAEELRINQDVVRAIIRSGKLSAIDVAAPSSTRCTYRVSRESLNAFIAGQTVTPPAPVVKKRRPRKIPAGKVTKYF